jgi:hypothetical protein
MLTRLFRAVGIYGIFFAGGTVGLVYVATGFVGVEFGFAAVILAFVGIMTGPILFGRGGTSLVKSGGLESDADGMNTFDEPETSSFISHGRDTPLKVTVGLYLLGVAAFSILGVVFLA